MSATSFLAETVRLSAPYVACALGATMTERAGVVNVAFEGTLLVSGLATVGVAHASGSAWAGLAAGVAAGALLCLVHGVVVVRGKVDAIVSGIALNLVAAGLARVCLRLLYDSSSNSPAVAGLGWGGPPSGAHAPLLRVLADPLIALLAAATVALPWVLRATRFGLRVRAAGEDPGAAHAAGIDVASVRIAASTLAGALAGLGGAHLVFDQRRFDSGMSGGRGFIALAAVIIGGWAPWRVTLACLGFAALEAAQIALQDVVHVPTELIQMLPYVATLVVLAGFARRVRPPAGLGRDAP